MQGFVILEGFLFLRGTLFQIDARGTQPSEKIPRIIFDENLHSFGYGLHFLYDIELKLNFL